MFKINLKPVIKDREFEVKIIHSGRKDHKCSICDSEIKTGSASVSFTKRVSVGLKTTFKTYRTCFSKNGEFSDCTITMAKKLNVNLEDIW